MRGDIFCDRFGGVVEIVLAGSSLGITLFRKDFIAAYGAASALYGIEILGAILIMQSRLGAMRVALWLFAFRVLAGLAYLGVIHDDKLARSTWGFPVVVLLYCIMRVKALKREREEI